MWVCGISQADCRKIQCVIGGLCAMCIAGQIYLTGNVATYMESYLRERADFPPDATWFTASLLSCAFVGALVGVCSGGWLDKAIGSHFTALLGLGCMILGTALTFWTLRVSTVAVIITFGVFPGVGMGCVYGAPYSALNKHQFKRPGLIVGIVNSGFGGGAVIFNYVISAFINPHNMAPDKGHEQGRFFSQPEVLDNTPYCFLLLSAIYAALLPMAIIGMRPPPPDEEEEAMLVPLYDSDSGKSLLNGGNQPHQPQSNGTCFSSAYEAIRHHETGPSKNTVEEMKERGGDGGGGGLSPLQLFRYPPFYILWISMFLEGMCNNAVIGFYKELGQTRIPDDMLLASMGTVGSLLSAAGRPLWGLLVDMTSFKTGAITQGALTCIFLAFWTLTLVHSYWLYFLWTVVLFALVSSVPVFTVLACKIYFGQEHFVANMAALWSAVSLQSFLLPFITSAVLGHSNWNTLIILLAVESLVSMVVCLLLPADADRRTRR